MSIPFIILAVVFVLGCAVLVGAILLQEKRTAGGMGSIAGMGNISDTYSGKNKSRTQEGKLELITKLGAVVLGVVAVILCLI